MTHAQLIVAHRGSSAVAPENTLPAFRLAWEQGADAIEGDFRQTKDGHVIAIHDSDTGQHGNKQLSVAASTLEELQGVDVGTWKNAKFLGTKIPTLTDVLKTVPKGKVVLIEIKDPPKIMAQVQADLRQAFANELVTPEQIRVISFDDEVITESVKLLPEVPAFLVIKQDRIKKLGIEGTVQLVEHLGASGLDIQQTKSPDLNLVHAALAAGLEMHTWTINDPAQAARFFEAGFHSVTTDVPDRLVKVVRK